MCNPVLHVEIQTLIHTAKKCPWDQRYNANGEKMKIYRLEIKTSQGSIMQWGTKYKQRDSIELKTSPNMTSHAMLN